MSACLKIDEWQQKKEFSDFIDQLLFRKFGQVQLCTGSCVEVPLVYFFETMTDIDNIWYSINICAISKGAKAPNNFKGTVLIIESEGTHHGYARLHFKRNNMHYRFAMLPEERPARLQTLLVKSDISPSLFSDSSYISKCLTNFQGLSRDIVEAIWCPNWPEEANEWKLRERLNDWPVENIVNRIINNGCLLVAKPHQGSQLIANEWRFSFSEAELFLIHSWSDVQMYIYHILRLIKSDVVRKCGGKMMTVLTTYHFKTLMFWACEEKLKEFWLPNIIELSVKDLILAMIEWLIEKQCRNYFMPGNNMLDHLPDSHNFEREVQFLTDSINLVDEYISNTVPFARDCNSDRYQEFSVRVPTNVFYALQLRTSLWYLGDPSRLGIYMYAHSNGIGKHHLLRSHIFNLFQCLTIHRRLTLAKDMKEKLSRLHEVEECFRRTYEKEVGGFTHVNISPMDNCQVILAKLLRKNLDSSNSTESLKSNPQHAESTTLHGKYSLWELCYSRTESMQPNHVAHIIEIGANMMNERLVKATSFQTAAYEANFYWTMFEIGGNENPPESLKKALDICNKFPSDDKTIHHSVALKLDFGIHRPSIIISNRWSGIFDKYIQVALGFLSLVKATTNRSLKGSYKLSDTNMDFDVLVQVTFMRSRRAVVVMNFAKARGPRIPYHDSQPLYVTDIAKHLFVEKGFCRGISMASECFAKVNNQQFSGEQAKP